MSGETIVTGVIGVDSHVVGNWLLKFALEEAGFHVIPLGVCVSQEEFINSAVETAADAILVSSIYGHGILDCQGLREKCQEAGLNDIILYAGGNLVVGTETKWEEVEKKFKAMGFDRAYTPGTKPAVAVIDLKKDLAEQKTKRAASASPRQSA